jgi:ABC-type glycerol-3-phosphate transport system substrate-binding protein
MGNILLTGAVAMNFTGGWALWGDLPEEFDFRYAPNPIGGVNGSGTRVNNTWAEPLQICSQTAYPDEAWEWVKYMTVDPDAIAIEIQYRSMIPAARSAFDMYIAEYSNRLAMTEEEQRTYFTGAMENAKTTVPCHILVGWAAIRDIFNAELEPVWLGDKTAKEAVDEMIPKINTRLEENLEELELS